jgi:hypothetical protein
MKGAGSQEYRIGKERFSQGSLKLGELSFSEDEGRCFFPSGTGPAPAVKR